MSDAGSKVASAGHMSEPRRRPSPTVQRVAFKTDRLGEFVGRRELTAQIGHPPEE